MPSKMFPDSTDVWLLVVDEAKEWPFEAAWWNPRTQEHRGLVESEARALGLFDTVLTQ